MGDRSGEVTGLWRVFACFGNQNKYALALLILPTYPGGEAAGPFHTL